jgi:hypothetical protein
MFPAARLNLLCQRRQELLAASEVHRRLLAVECAAVQQRLEWVDPTVSIVRRLKPFASLAAPLLSAWTTRRENREPSWIGIVATALPMAGRVTRAIQQFIRR